MGGMAKKIKYQTNQIQKFMRSYTIILLHLFSNFKSPSHFLVAPHGLTSSI